MNHFLINIQYLINGETAQTIYKYETREEAMSAYHSTLLYNYGASDVNKFICMVMDDTTPIVWENYERPVKAETEDFEEGEE